MQLNTCLYSCLRFVSLLISYWHKNVITLQNALRIITRMHSSRMCTVRCSIRLLGGGGVCPVVVCPGRGGVCRGGRCLLRGWVYSSMHRGRTPRCGQNSWHILVKFYLAATLLRTVITRNHSSRMCTTRLSTVCALVVTRCRYWLGVPCPMSVCRAWGDPHVPCLEDGGGGGAGAVQYGHMGIPSSQQNDRYTYVKTLPSRNFVR